MFQRAAKLCLSLLLPVSFALAEGKVVYQDSFQDLKAWIVEQAPGGTVKAGDGRLLINDAKGCTVWFRHALKAPVSISYDARVLSTGRVSDLNCFWMASDPKNPADLFHPNHGRNGLFATYDALQTYYVGYGGNANTTTRFRRYEGAGVKPLLPENDLGKPPYLLQGDRVYHIALIAAGGQAVFIRDGETLFTFRDPKPLTSGWFGFRTVDAQIEIRNFRVTALEAEHALPSP
ncbi:hypothetical protein DB347_22145 [Opitutaceae bacterium EW11]|nr:hypothetical protein DB347_22145 [Opitutaceae bacterium EW11]